MHVMCNMYNVLKACKTLLQYSSYNPCTYIIQGIYLYITMTWFNTYLSYNQDYALFPYMWLIFVCLNPHIWGLFGQEPVLK